MYDAIVGEFSKGLSPVMAQVTHPCSNAQTGMPFCARLRENGKFAPAVGADRFLNAFIQNAGLLEKHDLFDVLTGAGYTPGQARALCAFQLAGCFTAARTAQPDEAAWMEIKPVIDRFILGGIAACLAHARNAEDTPDRE